jgi:hypothetical protein
MTVGAPEGFEGQVLYIKEAVLRTFLGDRSAVWLV